MSEATKNFLMDYYKPYNQRLYELIGQNLGWDNYSEPTWYANAPTVVTERV
jgi:hypothetical protein